MQSRVVTAAKVAEVRVQGVNKVFPYFSDGRNQWEEEASGLSVGFRIGTWFVAPPEDLGAWRKV